MICLVSSDGEVFDVEDAVAAESLTLKRMIENNCADGIIPMPNVTSRILAKVIEYCRTHVASGIGAVNVYDFIDDKDLKKLKDSEEVTLEMLNDVVNESLPDDLKNLNNFDADFIRVDLETLLDLMKAAEYLKIHGLLMLTGKAFTDMFMEKRNDSASE